MVRPGYKAPIRPEDIDKLHNYIPSASEQPMGEEIPPLDERLQAIVEDGARRFPGRGKELPINPMQGYLLHWFSGYINARSVLEVGTFTGYTTIFFADALHNNGMASSPDKPKPIITCELVEEIAEVAKKNFTMMKIDDMVEVRVGDAIDTQFDLIFIDADKPNVMVYYDMILGRELLSSNGVLIVDNTIDDATKTGMGALSSEQQQEAAKPEEAPDL
ncbi:hypothetical protein EV182_005044, partial [Spiromyces aspiralis]